jgi:hypothetical protein
MLLVCVLLCVVCVFPGFLFCIGNLAPLHVVICEWLCHLLPPVFFLASSVYVCVCPGLCEIVCCVCFPGLFVCSVLVFWPPLRVVNCEWLCHLLPPVFFWLQVFMFVCVCVCPGRLLCGL